MDDLKLAVILPSRGLLSSHMREALDTALIGYSHRSFYRHNLPLPDCFNDPVEEMLRGDFTHALFVEEDVVIPHNALSAMLALKSDIAAVNYAVHCTGRDGKPFLSCMFFQRKILWVSLGCTLVRREVFEGMQRPWFRTDEDIAAIHGGSTDSWHLFLKPRDPGKYGGQDCSFCFRASQAGFRIEVVEDTIAQHLPSINQGYEAKGLPEIGAPGASERNFLGM